MLAVREDQWFDRKRARTRGIDLAPTISGMANAEGGIIALGIHGGRVEGVTAMGDENAWRRAVVRRLRQHQRASTGDLLKVTGLSRPVLRNHLETLRREGVISWHGNAPRGLTRAYWYLPG